MIEKQSYQTLVQDDCTSIDDVHVRKTVTRRPLVSKPEHAIWILVTLLAISFAANIIQAWHPYNNPEISNRSRYTKLAYNTNVEWVPQDEGDQSQEDLLDAISLDDGAIAVSKEWADENSLGETSVFPWDESKRVYFIHAYHGLHCVKLIYRYVKETRDNGTQIPIEHVIHCLDWMRKDIMCYADDTPRPRLYKDNSTDAIKVVGELRQCRDWSALEAWAKERPACFKAGHAVPGDMLRSQLKFCKDDSPYFPAVREYFGEGALT